MTIKEHMTNLLPVDYYPFKTKKWGDWIESEDITDEINKVLNKEVREGWKKISLNSTKKNILVPCWLEDFWEGMNLIYNKHTPSTMAALLSAAHDVWDIEVDMIND